MRMRLGYWGVVCAAWAIAACPQSDRLIGTTSGLGNGGGGSATADNLVFTVQPGSSGAGTVIRPAVQVTVRDSLGTPDSNFTAAVTIVIGNNPVGGNLSGTTSVTPTKGIALFGNLIIDRAGSNYTLQASAPGATAIQSAAFNIN